MYRLTITAYHFLPAGSDFNLPVSTISIPKNSIRTCVQVEIIADTENEGTENFFVELSYSGTYNALVIAPSTIEILLLGKCEDCLVQ